MVVAYLSSAGVIGGAEKVTLSVAAETSKENRAVFLSPPGPLLDAAEAAGCTVRELRQLDFDRAKPLQGLKLVAQLLSILRSQSADLVYATDPLAYRCAAPVLGVLGIPSICHVHFPYEASFFSWAFKYQRPNAVIFCSDDLKQSLLPAMQASCPDSSQYVVHNGIDVDKFVNSGRSDFSSSPRIGIVANLQKRKGHDDFLAMARELTDRGYDCLYDIVGGDILGEHREAYLRNICNQLNLDDRVRFHGQVSNVHEFLAKIDLIVCPSHQEAFPLAVLEAMASSKPIVATNVNGIPEAIQDGETGVLVNPHDPSALANAVASLIDDHDFARKIALAARKRVVENFSLPVFVDKIAGIEKSCIGLRKRSDGPFRVQEKSS